MGGEGGGDWVGGASCHRRARVCRSLGAWEPAPWAAGGYGLQPRFGLWLGSWRGPAGEEGPIMGLVPQGLLVQGAVKAVDFLLAVFLDGVEGGPAAHHLQHVAVGSRGSKGLSGVLPHLYHPLFSHPQSLAPSPLPSAAGLAPTLPALKTARIARHQILDQEEWVKDCGVGGVETGRRNERGEGGEMKGPKGTAEDG